MYDVGIILGFMIVIIIGIILLRYLCSFGYGLFCYNVPKPPYREMNAVHVVDIVNNSNTPNNKIIRVTIADDYIASSDVEISEQRIIPIANMV